MIEDLALRWIITALFAAGIAGNAYILAAQRSRWTCTVHHLLHVAMSVAMIVMAWPAGISLPTVGPMVFFLLAALWFVLAPGRVVFSGLGDRVISSYHAVKMTAMAWMYAVMSGSLPGQTCHPSEHTTASSPDMHMTGMDMAGMDMAEPDIGWTAAEPGWITAVNAVASAGFAVAALYWLYRSVEQRRTEPVPGGARLAHLAPLCQAFMAAGTALMFAVML